MGSRIRSEVVFAIVPEWILDHPDLSDRAVRVYGILARYADSTTLQAHPSRRTLAKRARCSAATLDRAIKELVAAGAVTVEARKDDAGDPTSNEYTLRQSSPVMTGTPTDEGTPTLTDAATGTLTDDDLTRTMLVETPLNENCAQPGCDRGKGHKGSHRNPWFEAIEQALGYKAPKQQQSRFAALSLRARDEGITPGKILEAAAWIVATWGDPKFLTINSLSEHLERALSPIATLTPAQVDAYRVERLRQERYDRLGIPPEGSVVVSVAPERRELTG